MDNETNPAKFESNAVPGHAKEARELPEARDETTKQIHELSDFKVSDYLGLPLLTKDVGKTDEPARKADDRTSKPAARWQFGGGNIFAPFDSRDRWIAVAMAAMILGPLFFGAMRH